MSRYQCCRQAEESEFRSENFVLESKHGDAFRNAIKLYKRQEI